MLSFVWNNPTKTEERSREFLLLSIVGLSSNLNLLVASADGTALETVWESRWPPNHKKETKAETLPKLNI
ncbi:hypothetical protein DW719_14600 [Ruminococcus sp. AM27-27]|nr:hypothetical protein DW719_14600 [Ruminococcus sp. AM27-27]